MENPVAIFFSVQYYDKLIALFCQTDPPERAYEPGINDSSLFSFQFRVGIVSFILFCFVLTLGCAVGIIG
jgi:hypothetical protein